MKKVLITLSVIIVLAIGIYLVVGLFNTKPPSPIITIGEKRIELAQGSYCWDGLINAVCADTSLPPEVIKHRELKPMVVSSESKIKIEFNIEPNKDSIGVHQWLNDERTKSVPLNENILTAPKEEGIYVYDVFARWERGDSSYAFVIEVR